MSDKSLYTVSLKGTRQQDPWIVVNADSPEELDGALADLSGDLYQRVADAASLFVATTNAVNGTTTPTRAPAPAGSDAPAQDTQAEAAPPARQRGGYQSGGGGSSYGRKKSVAGTGGRGGKKPKLSYEEASADCKHGERRRYAKDDWVAYFCPQPKGDPDTCDANFIDAGDDGEG